MECTPTSLHLFAILFFNSSFNYAANLAHKSEWILSWAHLQCQVIEFWLPWPRAKKLYSNFWLGNNEKTRLPDALSCDCKLYTNLVKLHDNLPIANGQFEFFFKHLFFLELFVIELMRFFRNNFIWQNFYFLVQWTSFILIFEIYWVIFLHVIFFARSTHLSISKILFFAGGFRKVSLWHVTAFE